MLCIVALFWLEGSEAILECLGDNSSSSSSSPLINNRPSLVF